MFSKLFRISIVIGFVSFLGNAHAASGARDAHKIGVGLGILSDPTPSIWSPQIKYNITRWLQVMGSYGKITATAISQDGTTTNATLTAFGAAGKVFVIPSWNLSPFVGAGYSFAKVSGDISFNGNEIDSGSGSLSIVVASLGIDHQTSFGFNWGGGINYVILPSELTDSVTVIPNVYLAWFF